MTKELNDMLSYKISYLNAHKIKESIFLNDHHLRTKTLIAYICQLINTLYIIYS